MREGLVRLRHPVDVVLSLERAALLVQRVHDLVGELDAHPFFPALARAGKQAKKEPLEVFDLALRNATPLLEVKPRRVGGATYQVPIEIRPERRLALARRWIVRFARQRGGKSMSEKLAFEILDAAQNTGGAVKRKEETHRMAESNKAFSHFRY